MTIAYDDLDDIPLYHREVADRPDAYDILCDDPDIATDRYTIRIRLRSGVAQC
jgi:hypothetical protein